MLGQRSQRRLSFSVLHVATILATHFDPKGIRFGHQEQLRILCIGLGGGSVPSFIAEGLPHCQVDVVELEPAVTEQKWSVRAVRLVFRPSSQLIFLNFGDLRESIYFSPVRIPCYGDSNGQSTQGFWGNPCCKEGHGLFRTAQLASHWGGARFSWLLFEDVFEWIFFWSALLFSGSQLTCLVPPGWSTFCQACSQRRGAGCKRCPLPAILDVHFNR